MRKTPSNANPMLALEIFEFIVEYKKEHDGNSPTYHEIVAGTSILSTNTAWYYVQKLLKVGLMKMVDGKLCAAGGEWNYDKLRISAEDVYNGSTNAVAAKS